jgi:hypothetical protein
MMENAIFQRNMLALSSCDPRLSARINYTDESPSISFSDSRTGVPVPAQAVDGAPRPFHSLMDPLKEGEKYLSLYQGGGYILFLGLGAGYHILPFLKDNLVSEILIIDRDLAVFKSIIDRIDLCPLILDPRVHFLIDEEPDAVSAHVMNTFVPSMDGELKTVTLGSRINTDPGYFDAVMQSVKKNIDAIANDFAVQCKFGKTWLKNMLFNLRLAWESNLVLPGLKPAERFIITGAGPSLEENMKVLKKERKGAFLIASDTSYPALADSGILPDLVLSIDCQHISYHHFIRGLPPGIPLLMDLASPPVLTRLSSNFSFFGSGHPFSQYALNNFRNFIRLDTSGGNVAHTAFSLALKLGAREISLYGVDFAYVRGKTYSRGTYQYLYHLLYQTRLHPEEGAFFTSIFGGNPVDKTPEDGRLTYTTALMKGYRDSFTGLLEKSSSARVMSHSYVKTPSLSPGKGARAEQASISGLLNPEPAAVPYGDFLGKYISKVEGLPEPYSPLKRYFSQLTFEQKDLWLTQFPLAAFLSRTYHKETRRESHDLLEKTRQMTLEWARKTME